MLEIIGVVLFIFVLVGCIKWSNKVHSSNEESSNKPKSGCLPKLLGFGVGFAFGGPIGAIIGLAIGSIYASSTKEAKKDLGNNYQQRDFNVSLLVLSAAVMRSDGYVKKSELDCVKRFYLETFGQARAEKYILMLREILKQSYDLREVCQQIAENMNYSMRLQIMHFLFRIAAADDDICTDELDVLEAIASYLSIHSDYDSIKAMFVKEDNRDYVILGVEETATNEEIKKAYRAMAKKYHPDRVSRLGDDVRKAAEAKFQEINGAYERIKKQRGIS